MTNELEQKENRQYDKTNSYEVSSTRQRKNSYRPRNKQTRLVKEENELMERKEKTNKNRQTRQNHKTKVSDKNSDFLNFHFKKEKLKIIPLGGLQEIGKNITVFEYGNEIILVDCGLEFPEDDMLGVDLVIPDITYLERNKEKIKGLVITHGH